MRKAFSLSAKGRKCEDEVSRAGVIGSIPGGYPEVHVRFVRRRPKRKLCKAMILRKIHERVINSKETELTKPFFQLCTDCWSMYRMGERPMLRFFSCRCGSKAERLICNQYVVGSIPIIGSRGIYSDLTPKRVKETDLRQTVCSGKVHRTVMIATIPFILLRL